MQVRTIIAFILFYGVLIYVYMRESRLMRETWQDCSVTKNLHEIRELTIMEHYEESSVRAEIQIMF